jgi:hypothetical protein
VILRPDLFRALIVAVDKYEDDRIPELKSPVGDTIDVLRWLGAMGVPWEQVTVHVASRSPRREDLDTTALALGTRLIQGPQAEAGAVRLVDAGRASIVKSLSGLLKLPAGAAEGLIVFLLGHGFQIPKRSELTTRVFLTEDYSPDLTLNIAIGHLMETLRYTSSLRHVTVVFDACSVQPFGDDERETVTPGTLDELRIGALNPATGVALCSASGQLELAQESLVEGEGSVFLSAFLEATEPDSIEDDFIWFEGDQPVLDLRRVMEQAVMPLVRRSTEGAQNPELSPLGAYTATGAIPLYIIDRPIDKKQFIVEQSVRDASRAGGNWVELAFDRRRAVERVRGLSLAADRFRQATSLVERVPRDSQLRGALLAGLLVAESDLRLQAEALGSNDWNVSGDMTDELRFGSKELGRAAEHGDRARAMDDPSGRLASAGRAYHNGFRELRLVMEVAYATAVWQALRSVVRRTQGLDADQAVRILSQWVAVADASYLSSRADDIAVRVGTGDESPGLLLLRHHGRLEHEQWWMRAQLDPVATTIADDLAGFLQAIRAQVADALTSADGESLQEAIRRLLEAYPRVSDVLDHAILEALGRRATSWRWRATG